MSAEEAVADAEQAIETYEWIKRLYAVFGSDEFGMACEEAAPGRQSNRSPLRCHIANSIGFFATFAVKGRI
ncbi:MAG: hypothetical protein AAGF23_19835 [Acidobacteriota bacterium]